MHLYIRVWMDEYDRQINFKIKWWKKRIVLECTAHSMKTIEGSFIQTNANNGIMKFRVWISKTRYLIAFQSWMPNVSLLRIKTNDIYRMQRINFFNKNCKILYDFRLNIGFETFSVLVFAMCIKPSACIHTNIIHIFQSILTIHM